MGEGKSLRQDIDEVREIVAKIDPFGPRSNRGKEWAAFAVLVGRHIEDYTVPQYGDAPGDQAGGFTERDIAVQIRKYINRMESGARGPEEAQRDLLKIAHYCAVLFFKRQQS